MWEEGTTQKEGTNEFANINRSTEKEHSLLKRALTITNKLLHLQLTDQADVL